MPQNIDTCAIDICIAVVRSNINRNPSLHRGIPINQNVIASQNIGHRFRTDARAIDELEILIIAVTAIAGGVENLKIIKTRSRVNVFYDQRSLRDNRRIDQTTGIRQINRQRIIERR